MDNNRGHVYHTLNNKIIDLRNFDYEIPQLECEIKYGWDDYQLNKKSSKILKNIQI